MDSFLFTLLLVFAIALGGRDQLIIAQFSSQLGRTGGLLVWGAFTATLAAAVMAYAGSTMAAILPERAEAMLVAFALAIAGFELLWPVKLKPMKEPTRSYVAIGVVVLARQIGDAARFVIFALAAQAVYPVWTMVGGAMGGIAAIALGWALGETLSAKFPLRVVRAVLAICLIIAALFIGLNARYTIF